MPSKGYLVMFSDLNLSIIYIKPFTSNNTIVFVSFLIPEWNITSPLNKYLLLNTLSLTVFKIHTDWLTQQAFISNIPSQMHPSPTTLWVVLIFMLSEASYFQQKIKLWLTQLCFEDVWLIYIYKMFHFDSLILSNAFLSNFLLSFCFGWQRFLLAILLGRYRVDLYFHIKRWTIPEKKQRGGGAG